MPIGLPTPAFACQIVELNAALRYAPVRGTAHDDDTSLGRGDDAVHQPVSENEMAEVVDDELYFEAPDLLQFPKQYAGVENQHVDRHVHGLNPICTSDDRIEVRKLQYDRSDAARHAVRCIPAFLDRSRCAEHMRTAKREDAHGLVADARIAARDDGSLPAEVKTRGRVLGRRFRPEGASWYCLRERRSTGRSQGHQGAVFEKPPPAHQIGHFSALLPVRLVCPHSDTILLSDVCAGSQRVEEVLMHGGAGSDKGIRERARIQNNLWPW